MDGRLRETPHQIRRYFAIYKAKFCIVSHLRFGAGQAFFSITKKILNIYTKPPQIFPAVLRVVNANSFRFFYTQELSSWISRLYPKFFTLC